MQKTHWDAKAYAKHAKQIKALCKAENLKAVILKDSCAHVGEYSFNGLPCDISEEIGFNPDYLASMPSGTLYYKDKNSPIMIDTANDEKAVLMPIRV